MGQGGGTLGAQLEERYFLQKVKLGQGSFGTVWRAVDRQKGDTVAIKQLDKTSLPRRGVTRSDIEREISMMKACLHENITQLFDTFEDNGSIYLALEYCDGGDFGDKVKERGMAASEPEVAEWMRQMCAAICAMHSRGICHRDVKPDNFMVSGTSTLKLSDFGLAIFLPKGKLLQEKCGTPAFMAPEQHHLPKRSAGYGVPADMWAVGVSMYMMMFGGKHPFLNDRGGLDDRLLLNGELDFRDNTGASLGFFGNLAALGGSSLRFSEEARSLCKRMVEPDPTRRISAEETNSVRWLRTSPAATPAAKAPPQEGAAGGGATPQAAGEAHLLAARRSGTPRETPKHGGDAEAAPRPRSQTPPQPEAQVVPTAQARARTPGPEGRKALEQAAKLEEQNRVLMTELEERKRREEELMIQQRRMEIQQKLFQKQRTQELEEIEKKKSLQERQLQAVQEELDKQKQKQASEAAKAAAVATPTPLGGAAAQSRSRQAERTAMPEKGGGGGGKPLRRGTKCRYESGTYGWMPAVVMGYNETDGTYNLDVRQHAALDKIAPPSGVAATEAWPPGSCASYLSASVNQWLPALITSFNEKDGTYNLDVRDHADIDRIRARADRPPERPGDEAAGHADARRTINARPVLVTQETTPLGGGGGEGSSASSGMRRVRSTTSTVAAKGEAIAEDEQLEVREGRDGKKPTYRLSDLEGAASATVAPLGASSAPGRYVTKGDVCTLPEHGMVVIESLPGKDGCYTVKVSDKVRLQASPETMRAPREAKFAWPPGTKVSYLSASVGKWIDANVVSFNASSCSYNLDVRTEAAPDKVRPR